MSYGYPFSRNYTDDQDSSKYGRVRDLKEIERLATDPNLTYQQAEYLIGNIHITPKILLFLYRKYYGHMGVEEVKQYKPNKDADHKAERPYLLKFLEAKIPMDIVELWANSENSCVIEKVVKRNISRKTLDKLLARPSAGSFTMNCINFPNLTTEQIDKLSLWVRSSSTGLDFFKQKNLSEETAYKIFNMFKRYERFVLEVTLKKNVPASVLKELADHENPWVRRKVGLNVNTSAEVAEKLADDPELIVKVGVARNPNLSVATLGYLHDIGSKQIQASLNKNPTWQEHIKTY